MGQLFGNMSTGLCMWNKVTFALKITTTPHLHHYPPSWKENTTPQPASYTLFLLVRSEVWSYQSVKGVLITILLLSFLTTGVVKVCTGQPWGRRVWYLWMTWTCQPRRSTELSPPLSSFASGKTTSTGTIRRTPLGWSWLMLFVIFLADIHFHTLSSVSAYLPCIHTLTDFTIIKHLGLLLARLFILVFITPCLIYLSSSLPFTSFLLLPWARQVEGEITSPDDSRATSTWSQSSPLMTAPWPKYSPPWWTGTSARALTPSLQG